MKRWIKRVVNDWQQLDKSVSIPKGRSKLGLFANYLYWVFKNHITYTEYFDQYKFYTLSRSEREEFITISEAPG